MCGVQLAGSSLAIRPVCGSLSPTSAAPAVGARLTPATTLETTSRTDSTNLRTATTRIPVYARKSSHSSGHVSEYAHRFSPTPTQASEFISFGVPGLVSDREPPSSAGLLVRSFLGRALLCRAFLGRLRLAGRRFLCGRFSGFLRLF